MTVSGRHSVLARLVVAGALALAVGSASAGRQQYEPLTDAVRTALAAAVRDESPREARFDNVLEKVDWLAAMSAQLPLRWKPDHRQRVEFLEAVHYEAQRAGLDPHLVLGLIEVESGFRRYAISSAGARGYMQVMPFWTGVIGDGDPAKLFDMRANLRYGCTILRHYLDIERGDLFRALGRYNGSLGKAEYPTMVLRAWKRWEARAPMARPVPAPMLAGRAPASGKPAAVGPVVAGRVVAGPVVAGPVVADAGEASARLRPVESGPVPVAGR